MEGFSKTSESVADDNRWNIPGRWKDITSLGREAALLLAAITQERPGGDISPRYSHALPPRWSVSRLYREVLQEKMPHHDDLRRAMAELHEKGILHLAYTYYSYARQEHQIVGLYKSPKALREAVERKYPLPVFRESCVEIYLVLPEDMDVDHSTGKEPDVS